MSQLKAVTDESFSKDVIEASKEKTIVLDFWASWCGPCRMLSPILEELAQEHPELEFVAVDVDANPELSQAFSIRSIPTVLVIENGVKIGGFTGAIPKSEIKKALKV